MKKFMLFTFLFLGLTIGMQAQTAEKTATKPSCKKVCEKKAGTETTSFFTTLVSNENAKPNCRAKAVANTKSCDPTKCDITKCLPVNCKPASCKKGEQKSKVAMATPTPGKQAEQMNE